MGEPVNNDTIPDNSSGPPTSTRRDFVKRGTTLTSGLILTSVYTKPSIQSSSLSYRINPSGSDPRSNRKNGSNGNPWMIGSSWTFSAKPRDGNNDNRWNNGND